METVAWIPAAATEFGLIEPLKTGLVDAYTPAEGPSTILGLTSAMSTAIEL
jgi:hypothetical protein